MKKLAICAALVVSLAAPAAQAMDACDLATGLGLPKSCQNWVCGGGHGSLASCAYDLLVGY